MVWNAWVQALCLAGRRKIMAQLRVLISIPGLHEAALLGQDMFVSEPIYNFECTTMIADVEGQQIEGVNPELSNTIWYMPYTLR